MRQRAISSADVLQATRFRLWQKMTVPKRGCWIWQGAKFRKGYGNFYVPGIGNIGAHIVVFLITHEREVLEPEDCVLHKCDNPSCCRPSHLFKGTKRDNTQDMISKGRDRFKENIDATRGHQPKGSQKWNAKLNEQDVAEILAARAVGIPQKQLAKKYGVRYQVIQAIEHRRIWKHVPKPLGALNREKTGESNGKPGNSVSQAGAGGTH